MDVGEADELGFRYPFTAIARMLGFGLMALHSRVRDQAWRDSASQLLYQWNEDSEDVIHDIPNDERRATPPASVYNPPAYPVHPRSPYLLRTRPLVLSNDIGPATSFRLPTPAKCSVQRMCRGQERQIQMTVWSVFLNVIEAAGCFPCCPQWILSYIRGALCGVMRAL